MPACEWEVEVCYRVMTDRENIDSHFLKFPRSISVSHEKKGAHERYMCFKPFSAPGFIHIFLIFIFFTDSF